MKKLIISFFVFHFSFFILHLSDAQIIHVPADEPTIQAGIDAANDGDTVLVSDGTYPENINFNGKAILVASHFVTDSDTNHINSTVIDGSQPANPDYGSVVTFNTGEDTNSVICGFTITGGTGMNDPNFNARIGGGILCYYATARIVHNKIIGNTVSSPVYAWGGGIACIREDGEAWIVIDQNMIKNNQALNLEGTSTGNTATGGGMEIWGNARIRDNIIQDNHAISHSGFSGGGGLVMTSASNSTDTLFLENNVIADNSVSSVNWWSAGGGLDLEYAYGMISGNIFQNNSSNGNVTGHGGGIKLYHVQGIISSNTLSYNQASGNTGAYGGGISIWYSDTYLTDNQISHNQAASTNEAVGGGVHYYYPEVVKFINNSVLFNKLNTDDTWGGAGVVCYFAQGRCIFQNNEFTGNAGPIYSTYPQLINWGSGGGLMIFDAGDHEAVVDGNIFLSDTAKYGGGLSIKHSFNLNIINNLFKDGYAYAGGGMDIVNTGRAGNTTLCPQFSNNTFYKNSTLNNGYAGALFIRCEINKSPVTFNNIFYRNQSPFGNDIFLFNNLDTVIVAFSNIDTANIEGKSPWLALENITGDPLFADESCHIDASSPCLNNGTDSLFIAGEWYYCPEYDFDGDIRPFPSLYCDPIPDIGADEAEFDCTRTTITVPGSKFAVRSYPNPFSDRTTVEFCLPEDGQVSLKLYDLTGREVGSVVTGQWGKGLHRYILQAGELQAGIYILRLMANGQRLTAICKLVVQ